MYNTETDQEIQAGFLDVGLSPEDIAVSYDSRKAFIMSSQAQKITAVDLTTNTVVGTIPLSGLQAGQGSLAAAPNGMIYASAADRVLEIDPRGTSFDNTNIRRQISLPGARVGKLHFTPDGTRALATNAAPQSGQLLFFFSLDLRGVTVSSVPSSDPALSGFLFDKIFIGENNRAFITTGQQSVQSRHLFTVALPDPPAAGVQPAIPTIEETFLGSLGTVPIVDSIAFSAERPNATRMFVSAPLNILTGAATNTLYTVNLSNMNVTGQTTFNFLPGPIHFVGPASTVAGDPASGILRYGDSQPNLVTGGRSLPFGIRVIGTSGQPLFNFPVTFSTTNAGVTFDGAQTVNTNAAGQAFMTITAPADPGNITISAAAGGLSTSFLFTVGTGTPGGGGGGGGSGSTTITVISGNGLIAKEGDLAGKNDLRPEGIPMVIEVKDASGAPVPNLQVLWTVSQGLGTLDQGTLTEQQTQRITTTDAQGRTQNTFRGGSLSSGLGQSTPFSTGIITVTAGGATATLYQTTIRSLVDGNPVPPPGVNVLAPATDPLSIVGKTGQTIQGAIRVQVAGSGLSSGGVIPFIGVSVRVPDTNNDPALGPSVRCAPDGIALTNQEGIATCDLQITGRTGSVRAMLDVGSFFERAVILQVNPGDPGRLRIVNGDNQSANAGDTLLAPLTVALDDGGGNLLAGQTVNWSVISGTATLANSSTITNSAGQATNTVRLGSTPGQVEIRATAVSGTQPTITFKARVNVTLTALNKISGDGQNAITGANFGQPIVVEVRDSRSVGVSGQTVTFAVTSGTATLSAATATTDANGRALTQVRAGANAGPIIVTASVTGLPTVTFNLTAQLPGPVIDQRDFFNAASGERGAIVPGGVYIMVGQGLAQDLRGCVNASNTNIGPWPTRLNGIEMQFGSTLAPILNVCNINNRQHVTFQAPFDLAPGGVTSIIVRVGTGSSVVNNVSVIDLQPGIFETTDSQNRTYAVAIRPNGTYVTPENPARYGEVIRIYITGAGLVLPAAVTGSTGVQGQNVVAGVVVGLNDAGVRLVSATYMEGMVGVYEISFEVTPGTPTGASRPLGVLLVRPTGQFVFPGNSPGIAIAP